MLANLLFWPLFVQLETDISDDLPKAEILVSMPARQLQVHRGRRC